MGRATPEAFEIHLRLFQVALGFHGTASFQYRYFHALEWLLLCRQDASIWRGCLFAVPSGIPAFWQLSAGL